MLPAAPLPIVLIQMTSPDVVHAGTVAVRAREALAIWLAASVIAPASAIAVTKPTVR